MQDDLITTAEVAELLGHSVTTINRWATSGRLQPAYQVVGRTGPRLYRRSDIDALLAAS